jgi:serine/threonine-protein kinase
MRAEAAVRPGDVVGDRYKVARALGAEPSQVFEAKDLERRRRVVLKVLGHRVGSDDGAVARFFREARAAAHLRSAHAVRILDVGRLPSGEPYVVRDFLEGNNLQTLLVARGPLAVKDAADYVMEACEALAEAHRSGIVHRDLKPAKLFRARNVYGQYTIKLLDLGISRTRGSAPDPVYLSPEQLRASGGEDHRSDVWSLGAVLFELVTAKVVWTGASANDVAVQIARDPAPRLSDIDPAVPAGFAAIVARCLEKSPARRYQNVADLAVALMPHGSVHSQATLERVLRASGGVGPQSTILEAAVDAPQRKKNGRTSRVVAAFTAVCSLAFVAFATLAVRNSKTELAPRPEPRSSAVRARAASAPAAPAPAALPIAPEEPAPTASAANPAVAPAAVTSAARAVTSSAAARPKPHRPVVAKAPAPPPNAAPVTTKSAPPFDQFSLRR